LCHLGFRSQCYSDATQIGICASLQQTTDQYQTQGIGKGLNIKGQGHVTWLIMDTTGVLQAILEVPAYHVPGCNVHLLSTSSLLQMYPAETISLKKG
jgi:hypothetical protein